MKTVASNVIIDRDMVSKIPKQVWSWEVPVLEAKFGEGKVRLLEEVEIEVEQVPTPQDEFARLSRAHGTDAGDGGTNMTYCELAYGRGKAAIAALGKEMKRKKTRKKQVEKPAPEPEGLGDPMDMV